MPYTVRFYTGDYRDRQRQANSDGAICYVEHHFNSCSEPAADYSMVVVATNASSLSKEWGKWYVEHISGELGIQNKGVSVGGYNGRGNGNLVYTAMPAILLEPCFISNPQGAHMAEAKVDVLAKVLVDSICHFFPVDEDEERIVAFSIGHIGKRVNPKDRGATSVTGKTEADLAAAVLHKAEELFKSAAPVIAVAANEEPLLATDEIADWAKEAHTWAVENGITDGLRPHDAVTREELWTMLHRVYQLRESQPVK